MGLLRSEAMRYGMLVLPVQDARRYIDVIGKGAEIQFEDMNAREMRRPYRKYVQRIDEMERILRFLFEELNSMEGVEVIKNKVDEFLEADMRAYKLDTIEVELAQIYTQFVKFKANNAVLMTERNQAVEEAQVVGTALSMYGTATSQVSSAVEGLEAMGDRKLGYLAGVIMKNDEARFARAVWRASRGNTFTQFTPIDSMVRDPKTNLVVQKSVFVIYFQGDGGAMHGKVSKVCNAFSVNLYNWPQNAEDASKRHASLLMSLREREQALEAYQNYMKSEAADLLAPTLGHGGSNSKIEDYRLFCLKEKGIYTILNQCEEGLALRINVWYPECNEAQIMELLKSVNENSMEKAILMPDKGTSKSTPPTHIRVNDYTEGWQEVINTYGIPKYQEANPAVFAIVTFPFIFGMMYGDIGHGTLLLLAGLFLVYKAEDFRFTVPALFQARYMVLSLGIFAVYAGFMYNDMFSIGLQLFPSGFADVNGDGHWQPLYDVKNSGGPGPYPFGLDWAWQNSNNELLFVNSLKMKLSVLFGVLQMTVGVFLRWSNAFYEKSAVDFFCECLPMLVFMLCFFGWMDFMILYKWVHPIDSAPSIINSLICMAMGQKDDFPLWDGSVELAQKLMIYTVCSVPIMLFFKPFILLFQHQQKQKKKSGLEQGLLEVEAPTTTQSHGDHEEEFEFGEVFIHQIIETIEYVLGTVSHTASYLRIWALSLAHQQLSLVFFQKTLQMGLVMSFPANVIVLYIMFTCWFGVTLGVLLGMDVLECFLHTLRLHWVEFQSKFYKANGEKFEPFNIKKLVTPTGEE